MPKRWVDFDRRLEEYRLCERISEQHTRILARSPTRRLMELLNEALTISELPDWAE